MAEREWTLFYDLPSYIEKQTVKFFFKYHFLGFWGSVVNKMTNSIPKPRSKKLT